MGINILNFEDLLVTLFSVGIFILAGTRLFEPRAMEKHRRILVLFLGNLLVFFTTSLFGYLFLNNSIKFWYIGIVLNIVFIFVLMSMMFEANIMHIFLLVLFVYELLTSIDYVLLFLLKMDKNLYQLLKNQEQILFSLSILGKLIGMIIVILFTKKNKSKIEIESHYTIKFIIISILATIGIFSHILSIQGEYTISRYIVPLVLILNSFFVYYVFNDFVVISNQLRRKSIQEERSIMELEKLKEIDKRDKIHRKSIHDYANSLICINGLLKERKLDELEDYLSKLSNYYTGTGKFFETGNSLMDIMINSKYEKAIGNDITLILRLDYLDKLKITDGDLVVLVGNLLDNAIENCLNNKKENREIYFSIKQGDGLRIMIRNPIEKAIMLENNIIKTSKKGYNHGIGMSNINDIINKYQGNSIVNVDDGYFTHLIEL